jgi:hypothetical protein
MRPRIFHLGPSGRDLVIPWLLLLWNASLEKSPKTFPIVRKISPHKMYLIHCNNNLCKCHNVSPPIITGKKKDFLGICITFWSIRNTYKLFFFIDYLSLNWIKETTTLKYVLFTLDVLICCIWLKDPTFKNSWQINYVITIVTKDEIKLI